MKLTTWVLLSLAGFGVVGYVVYKAIMGTVGGAPSIPTSVPVREPDVTTLQNLLNGDGRCPLGGRVQARVLARTLGQLAPGLVHDDFPWETNPPEHDGQDPSHCRRGFVALYVLSPKAATLATPGVTTRVGGALNYAPTTIGGTPGDAATRTTTTSLAARLRNG